MLELTWLGFIVWTWISMVTGMLVAVFILSLATVASQADEAMGYD